jgi:IS605 OrfB family transposase
VRDKCIFLNITIKKDIKEQNILGKDGIIGIDLGMNFLAVTTNSNQESTFYGGGKTKYKRWLYAKQRRKLQSLGTRSAKRKLKRLSGRERQFVKNTNHCIAKNIVAKAKEKYTNPIIVMEDLRNIRKNGKKSPKKHRSNLNKWAFYQLQQFIEYKALEQGIPVFYVDPKYTSQMCCKCGHIEKSNRNRKIHVFKCKKCGYTSNDDRVASINIRDRGVALRYIRKTRGMCQLPLCSV